MKPWRGFSVSTSHERWFPLRGELQMETYSIKYLLYVTHNFEFHVTDFSSKDSGWEVIFFVSHQLRLTTDAYEVVQRFFCYDKIKFHLIHLWLREYILTIFAKQCNISLNHVFVMNIQQTKCINRANNYSDKQFQRFSWDLPMQALFCEVIEWWAQKNELNCAGSDQNEKKTCSHKMKQRWAIVVQNFSSKWFVFIWGHYF